MTKDSGKIILKIGEDGIKINWKVLILVITVLFGGGGTYAGVQLVTKDRLDHAIINHDQIIESRNARQDKAIKQNAAAIVDNGKVIGTVRVSIDAIQEVQHKQIAREEARRVTQKINNRQKREEAFDRVYDANMKRLKKGDDPCFNIRCN